MEIRKLLCENCKAKVRTAEAIYQKQRRLKVKVVSQQQSGKVKITKK
jgi:hypothetical protein